ncbi:hypothetical protein [Variovorax sp. 160MFSha2.1]|uniref:hypothetical protein n=1 Tax=Variovorax sp. 160MFSha2.1 TaxID=3158367 RepID=UPI003AAC3B0C
MALGLRKIRWIRPGMGRRHGMNCFNRNEQGNLVLLRVYVKARFDNIPTATLLKLKEQAIDVED